MDSFGIVMPPDPSEPTPLGHCSGARDPANDPTGCSVGQQRSHAPELVGRARPDRSVQQLGDAIARRVLGSGAQRVVRVDPERAATGSRRRRRAASRRARSHGWRDPRARARWSSSARRVASLAAPHSTPRGKRSSESGLHCAATWYGSTSHGPTAACTRGVVRSSPGSRTVPFTIRTFQSIPAGSSDTLITPSAISCATASDFGPNADHSSGTAIGRAGARPGQWIIWHGSPSISTTSPRNSPRSCSK